MLLPANSLKPTEALRRFFLLWTLKEAYTKPFGKGLGFDFKRIDYDVPRDIVRIDGTAPSGWQFIRFDLQRGNDAYVGVAAQYVGERASGAAGIVELRSADRWIHVYDAPELPAVNATRRAPPAPAHRAGGRCAGSGATSAACSPCAPAAAFRTCTGAA